MVTLADPCLNIEKKSIIIINDNAVAATIPLTTTVTASNTFNFTLTISANTSAGVYNTSGNLIRTLWSGVRYEAGSYKAVWSGIMDDGTLAPTGTYQVKVLTNNVRYTWEGVIGNTSASLTNNVYKSYGGNTCFAFVGTKGFYGQFFYEGGTNSKYFELNDIGRSHDINVGVHAITLDCATDGTNVYWACADQYQSNGINGNQSNYIFASKAADNTAVSFTNQTTHNSGRENESYSHFIGWTNESNQISYTGIAVNSNFIFATKGATNQLLVFNKTTGAIVQTLSYSNPGKLAAGSNNELWMIVNGILKKFSVNATTGILTDLNINAVATSPNTVRISPDNNTILVSDAGTHQIKAYSNSTGALQWALGQAGGYNINGPTVANDKFMFDKAEFASPAIAYQQDGSFWVNDMGNCRTLHFGADRTYKEQIAYMPSSRSTNADPNNPTRVFGDELEFQRDYSKPLDNGINGSWKLVRNWKVGTVLDGYRKFNQVVTLSNGHTYATGDNGGGSGTLYDLTATGAKLLRSDFDGSNFKIEADGSLIYWANNNNQNIIVHRQVLLGFNSDFIPNWGNDVVIVTTPPFTATSPYAFGNNIRGASTNPNKYFFYNPQANKSIPYILGGATLGNGNHFAAIKNGGNTWNFQTSQSTFFDYHGDYPRNGDFDIGNNDFLLQHSDNCQALVHGTDIFWNVNAEFWQSNSGTSGVNIWNHFNEDGLLIGNFGVTAPQAAQNGEIAMAGNSFSTALVKVGSDYYIYHCDENRHSGVHSWHVSGLNTIAEQTIPITVGPEVTISASITDLNAGLPYQSTTFTGDSNWIVDVAPPGFVIKTSKFQYLKNSIDIYISGDRNQIIRRKLNNTQNLTNWNLSGMMSFDLYGQPTIGTDNYNYLEVLDINGKIIARFSDNADTRNSYYHSTTINKTIIAQGDPVSVYPGFNRSTTGIPFVFSYNNGSLSFNFKNFNMVTLTSPFETGANLAAPAYLRVNQGGTGGQNHVMDLYHLQFNGTK